jgi:hypothetical protein
MQVGAMKARVEVLDGSLSGFRVELMDLKDKMGLQQRDNLQRFEHMRAMFKSFGEAMQVSIPPLLSHGGASS